MAVVDHVAERFEASLGRGSAEAIAAWAATGRDGLLVLRDYLDGRLDPLPATGIDPINLIDNTSASIAAIAAAHADAFLEVFEPERFHDSTSVLVGLGQIDDPRATNRLAAAAGSADHWVRMQVAIGLGLRPSPLATASLIRLAEDHEYLVRYHAIRSLARIGDETALSTLRGLDPASPHEADVVRQAIGSIVERGATRGG